MEFLTHYDTGTPLTLHLRNGEEFHLEPMCTAIVQSQGQFEGYRCDYDYKQTPHWDDVVSITYDLKKHSRYTEEFNQQWWVDLGIELGILDVENHPEVKNSQFTWQADYGPCPPDWCHTLLQIMWLRMPMSGPGVLQKFKELRAKPEFDCVDDFNLLRMAGSSTRSSLNDPSHSLFPAYSHMRIKKITVADVKRLLSNGRILSCIQAQEGEFRNSRTHYINASNWDNVPNQLLTEWKKEYEEETVCC